MIKGIKKNLLPIRKLAGRFVIQNTSTIPIPIGIQYAAHFVCAGKVFGDYLEFGVFRGGSFIEAYHCITSAMNEWKSKKRFYLAYTEKERAEIAIKKQIFVDKIRFFAFDSFSGLPEPRGIDQLSGSFTKGRYDCSQEEFRRNLVAKDVDLNKTIIVPGFYKDSLTDDVKKKHQLKHASIVMIDCDLYDSTKTVLKFITDLVVDGTIIIFDGWFDFRGNPDLGEQRACREWLRENPHLRLTPYVRSGLVQNSFIVSVKKNDN